MKSKADHLDKRNYDDFNEFFCSHDCLKYKYSSEIDGKIAPDVEEISGLNGHGPWTIETLPSGCGE